MRPAVISGAIPEPSTNWPPYHFTTLPLCHFATLLLCHFATFQLQYPMSSGTTGNAGTVFDIKRFSIHDGPGIRTTVFLKGCPLRCAWCHNPESQRREPQIMLRPSRCIACGACVDHCPESAIRWNGDGVLTDRDLCIECGTCTAY